MFDQEDSSWALEEMGALRLGDKRLNRRAVQVLKQLGEKPTPSIPTACKGWTETLAAYRLFDNEKVTMEKVLAAHEKATVARIGQHPVVLCIEDTTELDYSTKKETKGLGALTYETRQGLLLHPTLAVTPDRVPLGCLRGFVWARDPELYGKEKEYRKIPIEEKESFRWIEGYRCVNKVAAELRQTKLVYVADRESDIYELFVEAQTAQGQMADLLIRVAIDRKLFGGGKLWGQAEESPTLGTVEFDLPKRDKRPGRRVAQTLRAVRVKFKAPYRNGKKLPVVEVTVILAKEENPPSGMEPVEWMLLTTRSVTTFTEAAQMMQWYLCRWQIEVFFHILKNGCKIEKLQLEHVDRLKPAIALYMIIAWRILYLTMLGRKCPDLSCDVVFDTEEWQAVYIVTKRAHPPRRPPRLDEMVKMIASYGGYLNRKGDAEPGPKTLWIGLQRTRDFVLGIAAQKRLQE
ncbi:MAG: IS4 family transposase [Nitrospinae bacterium]|nr:IS4 family transposase [Nitrospinota bacterium]